jgi:hypothetical protein
MTYDGSCITGDAPAEPLIRALIERSVDRLRLLATKLKAISTGVAP